MAEAPRRKFVRKRRVQQFKKPFELLGDSGRKILGLLGAENTASTVAKMVPCRKSNVTYWTKKLVKMGALQLQTKDVIKIYRLTPFGSKLITNAHLDPLESDPIVLKMHGVFAHFNTSEQVYKTMLKIWNKQKIANQILASKKYRIEDRNVLVRIFPNGKVSFIIGATQNPVDNGYVNRVYDLICRELKHSCPNLVTHLMAFRIERADVHVDCAKMPELHSIKPKLGLTFSIHEVKMNKRKFYRVEVRGDFNEAVKALVRLLGAVGKRFSL